MNYIQTGTLRDKAKTLVFKHGGVSIPKPAMLSDIPRGKALVCIIDLGPGEAAVLARTEAEFKAWTHPRDPRRSEFVLMNKSLAHSLAGV